MAERCGLRIPILLCEALQRSSVRFRDAKLKVEYGMTYSVPPCISDMGRSGSGPFTDRPET